MNNIKLKGEIKMLEQFIFAISQVDLTVLFNAIHILRQNFKIFKRKG